MGPQNRARASGCATFTSVAGAASLTLLASAPSRAIVGASRDLDVAIVGGGPAGLGAAYRLRDAGLHMRVFEKASTVGGRTRSVVLAGETVNTGAMFVYVGTESEAVCDALGVETVPVVPASFGVHQRGRTVIAQDDSQLVDGLELPPAAKAQLRRVLGEVRQEYERYTSSTGLREESRMLADVSLAEHLGPLDPYVDGIVRNAVTGGSTVRPELISAQYALRYFASYLVRASGHRLYIPRGMQDICEKLKLALDPGVLVLDSEVSQVAAEQGACRVWVATEGRLESWRARHVVLAVPGPVVSELATWLPREKLAALGRVPSSSTTVLSVVLDSMGQHEWDDVFAVATVEPPFNLVVQPRASADTTPSTRGRTYLNCYLSGDAEVAAASDDEALTSGWLAHFDRVFPGARERVLGTRVTRWPRCFSYPSPRRESVLPAVRAQVGGVHFAGDYASSTAGSHGALVESARVAAEIRHAMRL